MVNVNHQPELHILRGGTALTLVGLAASVLMYGSPVFSWLWLDADWSESSALAVDRAGAFALLAAVPMLFVPKAWLGLKLASGWLLVISLTAALTGSWHPWLAPTDHASRILAPLIVALWTLRGGPDDRVQWALRAATAMTFASHGVEALLGRGLFVDYALSVLYRLGAEPSQSLAEGMLFGVGIVDLACAAAILLPPRLRYVALWMATWGGFTALLRVSYAGWTQWPETLMRVANGAVPLTLFLLWKPRPETDA